MKKREAKRAFIVSLCGKDNPKAGKYENSIIGNFDQWKKAKAYALFAVNSDQWGKRRVIFIQAYDAENGSHIKQYTITKNRPTKKKAEEGKKQDGKIHPKQ